MPAGGVGKGTGALVHAGELSVEVRPYGQLNWTSWSLTPDGVFCTHRCGWFSAISGAPVSARGQMLADVESPWASLSTKCAAARRPCAGPVVCGVASLWITPAGGTCP